MRYDIHELQRVSLTREHIKLYQFSIHTFTKNMRESSKKRMFQPPHEKRISTVCRNVKCNANTTELRCCQRLVILLNLYVLVSYHLTSFCTKAPANTTSGIPDLQILCLRGGWRRREQEKFSKLMYLVFSI